MHSNDPLFQQLARRDAEQVRDRYFAWLPPALQQELVATLTRIGRAGLECYRAHYVWVMSTAAPLSDAARARDNLPGP